MNMLMINLDREFLNSQTMKKFKVAAYKSAHKIGISTVDIDKYIKKLFDNGIIYSNLECLIALMETLYLFDDIIRSCLITFCNPNIELDGITLNCTLLISEDYFNIKNMLRKHLNNIDGNN